MKTITLFGFIAVSGILFSQKGICRVKSIGSKYNKLQLIQTVENADWCGVYHITENVEITFDDESVVLLGNREGIKKANIKLEQECFQNTFVKDSGIYLIHTSGFLLRKTKSNSKNNSIKIH